MKGIPARFAIYLFALALLLAVSTCFSASRYEIAYRSIMCPTDWRAIVSQRYDRRDRFSWIVERIWITRCY